MAITLSILVGQKVRIFCRPHFVMIGLLGIEQNSRRLFFSWLFHTDYGSGQILTWFWRFTGVRLGTNRREWGGWIRKEKNVTSLHKNIFLDFFLVILYSVQHVYCRPLWDTAHLINGKHSTNSSLSVVLLDGFAALFTFHREFTTFAVM